MFSQGIYFFLVQEWIFEYLAVKIIIYLRKQRIQGVEQVALIECNVLEINLFLRYIFNYINTIELVNSLKVHNIQLLGIVLL